MKDIKISGRCPTCDKPFGVCDCHRQSLEQMQEGAARALKELHAIITPNAVPTTTTPPETPRPAQILVTAISILEHNGSVAVSIGKQLRDAVAQLETELGEALNWRTQAHAQLIQCGGDIVSLQTQLTAALAKVAELEVESRQAKEHHEFYRGKVSDYMGAEILWKEKCGRLAGEVERLTKESDEAKERAQDWQLAYKKQTEEFTQHDKERIQKITDLRARLSVCEQQRDGGKKDTERLDWLEANLTHLNNFNRKTKKSWAVNPSINYEYDTFPTLRQALDAAIAPPQGEHP